MQASGVHTRMRPRRARQGRRPPLRRCLRVRDCYAGWGEGRPFNKLLQHQKSVLRRNHRVLARHLELRVRGDERDNKFVGHAGSVVVPQRAERGQGRHEGVCHCDPAGGLAGGGGLMLVLWRASRMFGVLQLVLPSWQVFGDAHARIKAVVASCSVPLDRQYPAMRSGAVERGAITN